MEVTETSDLADLLANAGHAVGGGSLAKVEAQLLDRRDRRLSDPRSVNV
jgi:hypothetical protein